MGSFTRTMKLLASVLSVAAADYACCPYDEYGVPDPNCSGVLTEKSPFAANNVQLVAAESHACKAWEANAGAALEDHKADGTVVHDWGSCGYQRHFPWYNKIPLLLLTISSSLVFTLQALFQGMKFLVSLELTPELDTACTRSCQDHFPVKLPEINQSSVMSISEVSASFSSQFRRTLSDKSASLVSTSTMLESLAERSEQTQLR